MTTRRTTVLVVAAGAGCVLVPVGALAGFRVLFWVRRAGLLTRVGLSFHDPEDRPGRPR